MIALSIFDETENEKEVRKYCHKWDDGEITSDSFLFLLSTNWMIAYAAAYMAINMPNAGQVFLTMLEN